MFWTSKWAKKHIILTVAKTTRKVCLSPACKNENQMNPILSCWFDTFSLSERCELSPYPYPNFSSKTGYFVSFAFLVLRVREQQWMSGNTRIWKFVAWWFAHGTEQCCFWVAFETTIAMYILKSILIFKRQKLQNHKHCGRHERQNTCMRLVLFGKK